MEQEKKKSKLKIIIPIIAIIIIAGVMLGLVFNKKGSNTDIVKTATEENEVIEKSEEKKPEKVTETNYMNIEAIYVDNSYQASNNPDLKLVYVLYTAHTDSQNLKVDSKSMKITIGDVNTYENTRHLSNVATNMSSYYYSDYLKDIYVGSSLKILETFEVPQGDLGAGKTIKLSKNQIPETENILMSTDDIIFCDTTDSLQQQADPEGYANEMNKKADADAETVAKVKAVLTEYQYSFFVNRISYRLTFEKPDKFEMKTTFGTNGGTYTVKNGYIFITYSSNNRTVEIPYSWKADGTIDLDTTTAFDVNED